MMNRENKNCFIVLLNLGGPHDSNGVEDFLFRLFKDPFILPYSKPIRWILARLISRLRTPKAKAIYNAIGPSGGSPLYINTMHQADALQSATGCRSFVAMRYAPPFIEDVVHAVYAAQPDEIILLPLYPQYSMTTTQSAIQTWFQAAAPYPATATRWVPHFFDDPLFLQAHSELIMPVYRQASAYGTPTILLSAHGLPIELVRKGDPYPQQVQAGAHALSQILGLKVQVSYQSRVGPKKWLEPTTEQAIQQAGKTGTPLVVVPFAFVSEHSETLYELDIEYSEMAKKYDVPYYGRVPALGIHPTFIQCLKKLVENR